MAAKHKTFEWFLYHNDVVASCIVPWTLPIIIAIEERIATPFAGAVALR